MDFDDDKNIYLSDFEDEEYFSWNPNKQLRIEENDNFFEEKAISKKKIVEKREKRKQQLAEKNKEAIQKNNNQQTKEQLRQMRRDEQKLKNRVAAQLSRDKSKQEKDMMVNQIKYLTEENNELHKRLSQHICRQCHQKIDKNNQMDKISTTEDSQDNSSYKHEENFFNYDGYINNNQTYYDQSKLIDDAPNYNIECSLNNNIFNNKLNNTNDFLSNSDQKQDDQSNIVEKEINNMILTENQLENNDNDHFQRICQSSQYFNTGFPKKLLNVSFIMLIVFALITSVNLNNQQFGANQMGTHIAFVQSHNKSVGQQPFSNQQINNHQQYLSNQLQLTGQTHSCLESEIFIHQKEPSELLAEFESLDDISYKNSAPIDSQKINIVFLKKMQETQQQFRYSDPIQAQTVQCHTPLKNYDYGQNNNNNNQVYKNLNGSNKMKEYSLNCDQQMFFSSI